MKFSDKCNNTLTKEEDQESLITKEETSKQHNKLEENNNNGYISEIPIIIFPLINVVVNFTTIFLVLIVNYMTYKKNNSPYTLERLNYFDFIIKDKILYLFNSYLSSLCFISILITLYFQLKQRIKVPEYNSQNYKIYILLLLGFISFFLQMILGNLHFISDYFSFNKDNRLTFQIVMTDLNFFFIIFYSGYIIYFMKLFLNNDNLLCFKFRMCLRFYRDLVFIALVLVIAFMALGEQFDEYGKIYYGNYFKAYIMIPFVLHLMISLCVSINYYVMNFLNRILKQNINMDYLYI